MQVDALVTLHLGFMCILLTIVRLSTRVFFPDLPTMTSYTMRKPVCHQGNGWQKYDYHKSPRVLHASCPNMPCC